MYKNFILLILALLFFQSHSCASLILEDGGASPHLVQLFDALGLEHNGTVSDMNQVAQEKFLRKPGQERWEMEEAFHNKQDQVMPVLETLGVIHEVRPSLQQYDAIIIYGALCDRMRKRLQFLDILWSQGIRTNEIVFLVGERPLDATLESEVILFNPEKSSVPFRSGWVRPSHSLPATEAQAALMLWDQIVTNDELRKYPVQYISAPMKEGKDGQLIRPNTADTIEAWLKTGPKPGKYLAVSDNPYIPYQHQTMLNSLKKNGMTEKGSTLETVGFATGKDILIAVHLDNIARWLYTEFNASENMSGKK